MSGLTVLRDGTGLERALGGWNAARGARVGGRSRAQRLGERLEHGLRLVVRVGTPQVVDVQRDQRVVDEALEKLVREVDVEGADHRPRKSYVVLESRPPGQIDDY